MGLKLLRKAETGGGYSYKAGLARRLVPAEYDVVEYIQSSGTQYIDTGVIGTRTSGLKIYVDAQGIVGGTGVSILISGDGYADAGRWLGHDNVYWTSGGDAVSDVGYTERIQTTASFGTKVQYILNDVLYSRDGFLIGNESALLFKGGHASVYYCYAKLFSSKVWNNGELVRNFIPVKKVSNSEYGLYDTVSGQFFGNAGTGSFTGGPAKSNYEYKMLNKEVSVS